MPSTLRKARTGGHLTRPQLGTKLSGRALSENGSLIELRAVRVRHHRDLDRGLLEQPVGVASEHIRNLLLHLPPGHTNAIDNPAQVCLVDSDHLCEAILTHAGCVYPKLQIRVNVTLFRCGLIGSILLRRFRLSRHVRAPRAPIWTDLELRAVKNLLPDPFSNPRQFCGNPGHSYSGE